MHTWLDSFKAYSHPRAITLFVLGFSSGLPLMLVFSTLSFWLREAGLDRATIGFFSWIAMAYAIKWTWSPLVDQLSIPYLTARLGRRRSWLLLSQLAIAAALVGMAVSDPATTPTALALCAVLVAFSSATQDISIDAYRIEAAPKDLQATLAATYMFGYRLAMMLATAGALAIAAWADPDESTYQHAPWQLTYIIMAAFMLPGLLTTFWIKEPVLLPQTATGSGLAAWIQRALVAPFADFFKRYGWLAVLILALISCYRIADIVMGVVANVFYVDMGYTKAEVAAISKVLGVIATLVGAGLGGLLITRYSIMPILMLGSILSAITNLLFVLLSQIGHDLTWLSAVIVADNLSAGLATAAFIAYLSSLTNVAYSATQYALFSSVMLLFPKFLGGFSGVAVDSWGYSTFFSATAVLGIPVCIIILLAWRWLPDTQQPINHIEDAAGNHTPSTS